MKLAVCDAKKRGYVKIITKELMNLQNVSHKQYSLLGHSLHTTH
jgi:hypothetical protein